MASRGDDPRWCEGEERRKVQELFRNDPTARVLVATDAAGEGVNLQNANLMVNYDLPWNPNRLEQRFVPHPPYRPDGGLPPVEHGGRQRTREGDVFQRLFEKLEIQRARRWADRSSTSSASCSKTVSLATC